MAPKNPEAIDAQTYYAMADGRTQVDLAGLLHSDPSLREKPLTAEQWQAKLEKWLTTP